MVDLHRHTEYSSFDGFGKCIEVAKRAVELGYTSLSITDHGTTTGWVQHWKACKEYNLKPIFGVECYFLPTYSEEAKEKPTHLCLYAKNTQGIKNINRILTLAEEQKYYHSIVTFDILEKYSDGVMCSTACAGGYLARCIKEGDKQNTRSFLDKMKAIFKDDFYIEIQPYKITDVGLQEMINRTSISIAKLMDVQVIMTSDSHFVRKEDLPTYIKMHEIAKHTTHDVESTYKERYMPSQQELEQRFITMHPESQGLLQSILEALQGIEDKVDPLAFDGLQPKLPKVEDAKKQLINDIKKGLTEKGKTTQEYRERAKEEVDVIAHHGYCEYFLMVADYVNWAKRNGIIVGAGRGSGCNSLVNYALKITDVDPIVYDLDFNRFLRKDKKKMPDIDVDFQTSRREEVLDYLTKGKKQSAQICSYGLYKTSVLVNDLAKVCGIDDVDEIKELKDFIKQYEGEQTVDIESLLQDENTRYYNKKYDNIIEHFSKLYGKVRYIGTHAAGVAIVDGDISEYSYIKKGKDGKRYCVYDLADLEAFGIVKFDILGLQTLDTLDALQKETGAMAEPEQATADEKTLQAFADGDTDGIFQFERETAKRILRDVKADTIQDIIATNAMNRPAPLKLGIPKVYAESKREAKPLNPLYGQYLTATHGCILYQEQVQAIAVNIGGLAWADADTIIKSERGSTGKKQKQFNEIYDRCLKIFVAGATEKGMTKEEAEQIYDNFYNYAFNRGHATGYSIISAQEMYYKVHYPIEYWATKLRQEDDDKQRYLFKKAIVKAGIVILPPRHNGVIYDGVTALDGEKCIQEGIYSIKGIGKKAVELIEQERATNGDFEDVEDFVARCKGRAVTSKTIELLVENSVFDYDDDNYIQRVIKYNGSFM